MPSTAPEPSGPRESVVIGNRAPDPPPRRTGGPHARRPCGASGVSAPGGGCGVSAPGGGRGGNLHRARGDALFAAGAVMLQLDGVPTRRVPGAGSPTRERPAPHRQRAHHEAEPPPALGERVRGARRPLGVEGTPHQSLALHPPQPIGQQLRWNARQLDTKVLKSRGPPQQIAHNEERPALADQVERLRDWAMLAVPLRHAPEYSRAAPSTAAP